jgi:hypothetical protein
LWLELQLEQINVEIAPARCLVATALSFSELVSELKFALHNNE